MERRNRRETLRERKRSAYHEAGHAVVAVVYGFRPYLATIAKGDGFLGRVGIEIEPWKSLFPLFLSSSLVFRIAGIAAQSRYSRQWLEPLVAGGNDLEQFVDDWLNLYVLTEGRCGDYDAFDRLASLAVKQYWYAIRDFASLLLERETVEGEELRETLSKLLYTSEYEYLPVPDEVCPFDPAFEFPAAAELKVRTKALRAQAELEVRSREVRIRAEPRARINTLHAGARVEACGEQSPVPISKPARAVMMSRIWRE